MPGPTELLECSWGRIRLFASQVSTDGGRTQVVHGPSSGDVHVVQDRGLRERRVRLRLQFDDFPGAPPPLDAARALEAAKNSGQSAIFQHPILGRYLASVGDFNADIDDSSVISADVEFIQEAADLGITPTGASAGSTSGESAVAAAAAVVDDELAKVGQLKMSGPAASSLLARLPGGVSLAASLSPRLSTDLSVDLSVDISARISASITANARASASASASRSVTALAALPSQTSVVDPPTVSSIRSPVFSDASAALAAVSSAECAAGMFASITIDARVAVSRWTDGEVPARQVMIDCARISSNIATMIEVGGFELDIVLWPAFRAAILLGQSIREAAMGATSESRSVFIMRVVDRTALLPLAARIYGGAAAENRARQISELNDISTPGWLPPGDYLVPIRPAAPF